MSRDVTHLLVFEQIVLLTTRVGRQSTPLRQSGDQVRTRQGTATTRRVLRDDNCSP